MSNVYRTSGERPRGELPPAEFIYDATDCNAGTTVLRVDEGTLHVAHASKRVEVRLDDLADVTLEYRTRPGLLWTPPPTSTAPVRIVLVDVEGSEARLTEDWVRHLNAAEWLGKIRAFLRTHGWVPEDEREA
jgi:hypothetical protein